ncbi:hypothetical protein I552_1170 [Mycobacterium xenopi 3993]|nr:hypothetical protein I552_1170 [Mycobacterium xenopi 3993]
MRRQAARVARTPALAAAVFTSLRHRVASAPALGAGPITSLRGKRPA